MKSPLVHLIIWVGVCGATLGAYGYWYAVIAEKSVTVATLQGQISAKTATLGRIASVRATLAEIADDEAEVLSYFVPETGVVPFIDSLEARAKRQAADLKVLSVATGGTATEPTLVFSLTIDGTFDAVVRTIGTIEYAPYDLSISRLTFGDNGEALWHASLELVVGSIPSSAATSTPVSAPKVISLSALRYGYF